MSHTNDELGASLFEAGYYDEEQQTLALAYLFEGEGCVTTGSSKSPAPHVRIRMTDEEPIRRAWEFAGCGKVVGPTPQPGNRKPIWEWRTQKREDFLRIYERLTPHLSPRRRAQFENARNACGL